MNKLIMCIGLPASGKTTWALNEKFKIEKLGRVVVIVCKDDIREELATNSGWKWSPAAEQQVISIRNERVLKALTSGYTVISSDTNFGKHKQDLKRIAEDCGVEFEVKDFTAVPLEVCIARDAVRKNSVGINVITNMYNKYLATSEVTKYEPNWEKPIALICDLDGTLAIHNGRSSYDYAKCGTDLVNEQVINTLKLYTQNAGYTVIYCSGREEWCREQTEDWLVKNGAPLGKHHKLFMRSSKDHRKDYIVKQEIFDKYIRNEYNVRFVLDDRTQVVKMWRALGLQCWQVAEGDF